jgi:hypothetical protein
LDYCCANEKWFAATQKDNVNKAYYSDPANQNHNLHIHEEKEGAAGIL